MFKRENNDESFNRRYQSLVSEWGNPFCENRENLRYASSVGGGTGEPETSQYPKENKTIVIALVAASERATV